jgi:hypothetical protein
MKCRYGALMLLLGAATFAACDDAESGSTGGQGGAVASGGAGGTGSNAGTGGTGTIDSGSPTETGGNGTASATDCFPACIARIRQTCRRPTTGTCVHESLGATENYCYSNGMKEVQATPPFVPSKRVSFFTPAGALCYSTEVVSPPGSAMLDIAFKDATGKEIARGKVGVNDFRWQITCDGQTTMVNEYAEACDEVVPGDCTQGFAGSCP